MLSRVSCIVGKKVMTKIEQLTKEYRSLQDMNDAFHTSCELFLFSYLKDTDEDHPMIVDIPFEPYGAFGMSTLEWPRIVAAYYDSNAGTIWFEEDGYGADRNIDDYPAGELFQIVKGFEEIKTK